MLHSCLILFCTNVSFKFNKYGKATLGSIFQVNFDYIQRALLKAVNKIEIPRRYICQLDFSFQLINVTFS